jgi:hypothetical protein
MQMRRVSQKPIQLKTKSPTSGGKNILKLKKSFVESPSSKEKDPKHPSLPIQNHTLTPKIHLKKRMSFENLIESK